MGFTVGTFYKKILGKNREKIVVLTVNSLTMILATINRRVRMSYG